MPIYEYQCSDCQHEFEALQKMSDDPLTQCPQCKQHSLVKKISAAAFRLSGSGWYETDFKSGNKKNLANGSENSPTQNKGGDGSTSAAKTTNSSNSTAGGQSSASTSTN